VVERTFVALRRALRNKAGLHFGAPSGTKLDCTSFTYRGTEKEEPFMGNPRVFTTLLAALSLLTASTLAIAAPGGQGKGNQGKGQERAAKHMHKSMNGKAALGEKLKRNGKHEVGKIKDRTVTADVDKGKVRNMAAGDLPMKRVKSTMKMASVDGQILPVVISGVIPAQFTEIDYYYGYCFDDGYDLICYWYEPQDVYYSDYYWDDYDPYY
jgi:hypothetical protein